MKQQVITYIASKPFRAKHPADETGEIVHFKPGDVVPAEQWGASANWLKESGKIFETATVVDVDDVDAPRNDPQVRAKMIIGAIPGEDKVDSGLPGEPLSAAESLVDESAPVEDFAYPLHEGAGWYRLSSGDKVRGKDDAIAAEAALGGSE